MTILRRAYSESVRERTAWQASDGKIKKWKLKGLVHSRRAKDQLTGLLAAFALTRYSRRLNQDVFVVQASHPALAGRGVKTFRSRKHESYEKNQLGAKQQTNDSQRAVGPAVAVLVKERKHAHKGDEVGTEKSAARHLRSSASFLTSCRESGRTTPGSDR